MYTDDDIESAVAAGALSAQAAEALRRHAAARRETATADEEYFRLVTGFNDIFVVIASGLLLGAVLWIGGAIAPWLGPLGVAAASWALAEFFVRRRRMALPAIALLLAFVGAVFFAARGVLPEQMDVIGAGIVAAGAAWLHWRRFHVPITPAAGAAALIVPLILLVNAMLTQLPQHDRWLAPSFLVAGLAVFAWALWWDASDPRRATRRADVAFWLHLLAAPLLVHPVFAGMGIFDGDVGGPQIAAVLLLYGVIALVSLAIDRRALMVSALGYVIYACATLLQRTSDTPLSFAFTALVIGAGLLLLSALWQKSRAAVLRLLPARLTTRLPPPR